MQRLTIELFVAHEYRPNASGHDPEAFRFSVRSAVQEIEVRHRVSINPRFATGDEHIGSPLSNAITSLLSEAHLGIVELSTYNPNVMYEYGFLSGQGKVSKVFQRENHSNSNNHTLPANIAGILRYTYKDYDELRVQVVKALEAEIDRVGKSIARSQAVQSIYDIWFPRKASDIYIVAGREQEAAPNLERSDENQTLLNRCCDKDALLQVYAFLHRHYVDSTLHILTDREFKRHMYAHNTVILGGPGAAKTGTIERPDGNSVCRDFQKELQSSIKYSSDGKRMQIYRSGVHKGPTKILKSLKKDGNTIQDWGCFAACQNPNNPNNRVVMIHGLHTFGVAGAAIAFADSDDGLRNLNMASSTTSESPQSFETFFAVDIDMSGKPRCPKVLQNDFFSLSIDKTHKTASAMPNSNPGSNNGDL